MRCVLVLGLAGCWTSPPPPVTPPAKPAPIGTCEIRDDGEIIVQNTFELSLDGAVFAARWGPFEHILARLDNGGASAKLEDDTFVLEGELDLAKLQVRTRSSEPHAGWVEIREATPKGGEDAAARIEVVLPDGIAPPTVEFSIACTALTFAVAPVTEEQPGDEQAIGPGTLLYANPGERRVASVMKGQYPIVHVLERRGPYTRVKTDGTNPLSVWVARGAVNPIAADRGRMTGSGGLGARVRTFTCERDVPIYVRRRTEAKVGHVKKGAAFRLKGSDAADEVELELGQDAGTVPFLKRSDFVACSVSP